MRHYQLLLLPILTAVLSLLLAFFSALKSRGAKPLQLRLTLLFGLWWLFDIAFVWISPRSYEEYYLPLNASAAMLGAFGVFCISTKLFALSNKAGRCLLGFTAICLALALSWHIFFDISKSPYTAIPYPQKSRGYLQKFREISLLKSRKIKNDWANAADYIRQNSSSKDGIYVWGGSPASTSNHSV